MQDQVNMEMFLSDTKIWDNPMFEHETGSVRVPAGMTREEFHHLISNMYNRLYVYQQTENSKNGLTNPDPMAAFKKVLEVKSWKDYLLYAEIDLYESILICWLAFNGYHEAANFERSQQYGQGMLASVTQYASALSHDKLSRIGLPITKTRTNNGRKFWRAMSRLRQIGLIEIVTPPGTVLGRKTSYLALTSTAIDFAKDLTRELNNFAPER